MDSGIYHTQPQGGEHLGTGFCRLIYSQVVMLWQDHVGQRSRAYRWRCLQMATPLVHITQPLPLWHGARPLGLGPASPHPACQGGSSICSQACILDCLLLRNLPETGQPGKRNTGQELG